MKTINVIGTNEIVFYNEYSKPFKCLTEETLPPLKNVGWNTYEFIENVKFNFSNIPTDHSKKWSSENYIFEESTIEVFDTKGNKVYGFYTKCTNRRTNEIIERFNYS